MMLWYRQTHLPPPLFEPTTLTLAVFAACCQHLYHAALTCGNVQAFQMLLNYEQGFTILHKGDMLQWRKPTDVQVAMRISAADGTVRPVTRSLL